MIVRTGTVASRTLGATHSARQLGTLSAVQCLGKLSDRQKEVVSKDALEFVGQLHRSFNERRLALLRDRPRSGKFFDKAGGVRNALAFDPATAHVREDTTWRVAPLPADLVDRRVEITGPPVRKMVINALNSGAACYMADLEDSLSPTWTNVVEGQINLHKACTFDLDFVDELSGQAYSLTPGIAEKCTLHVRPRGLHLDEQHVLVDGQPTAGAFFDFGVFAFNNAARLLSDNSGPLSARATYTHVPKGAFADSIYV